MPEAKGKVVITTLTEKRTIRMIHIGQMLVQEQIVITVARHQLSSAPP